MKKSRSRVVPAGVKAPTPEKSAPRPPADLAEIRRRITEIVGDGAIGMVETTIEEVGKGHYLGMKFLFEMIGLYPATSAEVLSHDRFHIE